MAMSMGGGGSSMADINVTPMIDILLVLLIIFMVIVPVTPKGLDALVPQPPKNPNQQQPNDRTIVVSVLSSPGGTPSYKINQDDVAKNDLRNRLDAIYASRAEKVMFIKGDPDLNFTTVAEVVDMAHGVGVDHIGLITPKLRRASRLAFFTARFAVPLVGCLPYGLAIRQKQITITAQILFLMHPNAIRGMSGVSWRLGDQRR